MSEREGDVIEPAVPPRTNEDDAIKVRVPQFPLYRHVVALLRGVKGKPLAWYSELDHQIRNLTGTPQANVDWSNPDDWIPARLKGNAVSLALDIWCQDDHVLNPRYTRGSWYAIQSYGLMDREDGVMVPTPDGDSFLLGPEGDVAHGIVAGVVEGYLTANLASTAAFTCA